MLHTAIFIAFLMQLTTSPAQTPPIPVIAGLAADPSARVFNGKLYIYPSHDLGMPDWNMFDFHAYSSDDGATFKDEGEIFSVKDLTWATQKLWAPDCIEKNGTYYLYFAANNQIGVATSKSPTGPFKDALGKPLLATRTAGLTTIDANVFIDTDGQAYLYFGNDRGKVGIVKLNADMISLAETPHTMDLKNYHEGIWVHKHGDTYYFSYPSFVGKLTANLLEYSTAPSPTGPFTYHGVLLDNQSRNVHGSIVDFKGKSWLVYHIADHTPYIRRTYMAELHYNPDGTIQPLGVIPRPATATTQEAKP
ncbi:MAG TPA: family 43 glycosylhydrolase [Tepidisphaeraceae bacterium]|nr:family 43 glycosylhydrolase [Tepidisphaeraceae bacterium]